MPDTAAGLFISTIMETLNKNGFPDKKVSLPLEKLYESAHNKGVNFNKVLEFLKEKQIFHTKTDEKIIFTSENPEKKAEMPDLSNLDFSSFAGMDMGNLMKKASELMKNMSPDQMQAIKNQFANMDPQQIEKMKNMFTGMTEEQKKEMMEKAKEFKGF